MSALSQKMHTLRAELRQYEGSQNPEIKLWYAQAQKNLAQWEEVETALDQAVELALHVEKAAKGELEKAARRFLSLPFAEELKRVRARNQAAYDAIDHELVTTHILTKELAADPKAGLAAVIDWHVQVALDPAVSAPARELIERGQRDGLPDITPPEDPFHDGDDPTSQG